MFVKKFIQAYRNIAIAITQLTLPALFTLIALTAAKTEEQGVTDEPALALNLAPFKDSVVAYSNGSAPSPNSTDMMNNYKSQFGKTVWVDRTKYPKMDDFFGEAEENTGIATFNR